MSAKNYKEAFVWLWLPEATEPVVAGKLEDDGHGTYSFRYGKEYLARANAVPLFVPELPLQPGKEFPTNQDIIHGCIRDSAPDAWGRRVLLYRKYGHQAKDIDPAVETELTYLLETGSDRIGALDFQSSATEYVPRHKTGADLNELAAAADAITKGVPISPELADAIQHGTSIGGARPKALLNDYDKKYVAKFSVTTDTFSVVGAEFLAMRLAALCGMDVAPVSMAKAADKDVLIVERFDRELTENGWTRKQMVSALTIFNLSEMISHYASYKGLADKVRERFEDPKNTQRELFKRMTYNVLCGNTDDHARNHAAFWDGKHLALTPAYDICPQIRNVGEVNQAMAITGSVKGSRIQNCIDAADQFGVTQAEAADMVMGMISTIGQNWREVCDEARLTAVDQNLMATNQFLNPSIFYGLKDEWEQITELAETQKQAGMATVELSAAN